VRILFVADARSPIAQDWINYFIERRHDVHIISTYPCDAGAFAGAMVYQLPLAFAGLLAAEAPPHNGAAGQNRSRWARQLAGLRKGRLAQAVLAARMWAGPLTLPAAIKRARGLIQQIAPDVVHAMRIPFEGMLAAQAAGESLPLLVSVWGNDLTLFASRYPIIARQTRRVLQRADALHCDCRRDLDLAAQAWGFQHSQNTIVLPGAGGIHSSLFHGGEPDAALMKQLGIAADAPVIINPRGFRSYVRNDSFFAALPAVLNKHPRTVFLCVAMQGNRMAERWVKQLGITESVRLLPQVARDQMPALFQLAQVAVSPSLYDGTPNTLLEAMACGCLPVAGRIESVCEWIDDGVNGLLCDTTSADSLATAMIRGLDDEPLRQAARERNGRLIAERAEYQRVMQQAEQFYLDMIAGHRC